VHRGEEDRWLANNGLHPPSRRRQRPRDSDGVAAAGEAGHVMRLESHHIL